MNITKVMIREGLQALGLKPGDYVIVHSALSSLGDVVGGADAVIDALMETVGPQGLVVMPHLLGGATLGKLFSARPGVKISLHPTHAVAAWGARAEELVRDHIQAETASGQGTPFAKLIDWGGYVLLLGVDQDRNTTLHTAEDYADAPYLSEYKTTYRDEAGVEHEKVLKRYPGPHRNFIGLDPLFRRRGILRLGRIGNAVARLMKASEMVKATVAALRENPAAVLCDNPHCADCLMQKGKIKAARLQGETFTLSAVSDEISLELDEVLKVLQTEGICHVELRRIGGKALMELSRDEMLECKRMLKDRQCAVSAIDAGINRVPAAGELTKNRALFTRALDLAEMFATRQLIVTSFQVPAGDGTAERESVIGELRTMADLAGQRSLTLLLENEPGMVGAQAVQCEDLIRKVKSPWLKLAFNPANFARMGAKPFLGISSHVRKFSRQLYLNDALFSGPAQPIGCGNAEVKELISILRCRSFDGFLTIKHGMGEGAEPFRRAAAQFWSLLDTM